MIKVKKIAATALELRGTVLGRYASVNDGVPTGRNLFSGPRTVSSYQLKKAPLMTAFAPVVLVFVTFTFTWPVMLHL